MSGGQNNPNAMHQLKTHKPTESAVRSIGIVVPLEIGTETRWGTIAAVGAGTALGERYYWIVDKNGDTSMMPAMCVEAHVKRHNTKISDPEP